MRWTTGDRLLFHWESKCLSAQGKSAGSDISLAECDEANELQQWECKNETLLALKGSNLYIELTADNTAFLSQTTGDKNHLTISGTRQGACTKTYRGTWSGKKRVLTYLMFQFSICFGDSRARCCRPKEKHKHLHEWLLICARCSSFALVGIKAHALRLSVFDLCFRVIHTWRKCLRESLHVSLQVQRHLVQLLYNSGLWSELVCSRNTIWKSSLGLLSH